MSTAQIAVNHLALTNLAARLEQLGYVGEDTHRVAESIALNLLADGYQKLEPPVPAKGVGAQRSSIDAARVACAAAVKASRDKRKGEAT